MWRWQSYTVATNFDGTFVFESCVGYPEYQDVDATWKTAQAFSIMTFIVSATSSPLNLCSTYCLAQSHVIS